MIFSRSKFNDREFYFKDLRLLLLFALLSVVLFGCEKPSVPVVAPVVEPDVSAFEKSLDSKLSRDSFVSYAELLEMEKQFPREAPVLLPAPLFGKKDSHRVLVIGFKGGDWMMVRPLIDEGRLPNLARLLAAGAAGNLVSDIEVVDLTVETPAASGMPYPKTGPKRWMGPHVWELAEKAGRKVVPVAYVSYEGQIYGPKRIVAGESEPALSGKYAFSKQINGCKKDLTDSIPLDYKMIGCLAKQIRFDLFYAIFRSVHYAGDEGFWDWADTRLPKNLRMLGGAFAYSEVDQYTDAMIKFDEALGPMIEKMTPDGTVIICSSRGFVFRGERWISTRMIHRIWELLGVDAGLLSADAPQVVVNDGNVKIKGRESFLWDTFDWTDQKGKSRRSSVHMQIVELTGETPNDILWLDRVEGKLKKEFRNYAPHLNVRRTAPTKLFIEPNKSKLTEALGVSRMFSDPHRTLLVTLNAGGQPPGGGGIFLAAGPAIRPGARLNPDAKPQDVAPTILHLMNLPIPKAMQGRVLKEILIP